MPRLAVALALLALPGLARADLDDAFTFGLEAAGVRRSPEALRASSADAAIGARLKFFRGFGIDASCTFGAVDAIDPSLARTTKELFPSPNVRLLGILEPFPNRWFSPYLVGGAGWATRTTSRVSTWLAGLGLQIGMGPHVAIALEGFLLLPRPDDAASFLQRSESARLAGQDVARVGLGDLVNANRIETQLVLRYYL